MPGLACAAAAEGATGAAIGAGIGKAAVVAGGGCPRRRSRVSWPETQVSRVTSVPCRASRMAFSLSTSIEPFPSADTGQVLARARVDLQRVALVDEERD